MIVADLQQRIHRAKAENLWLLAALVLAFLPHFLRLSPWIILPSAILLGWRLLFELQYLRLPPRSVRWLLTLLGIAATYLSFGTLVGRFAGVGLLVIMLSLKLMEMNSQRDVGVVIGLSFFVVVTVFMFDQSIFMGGYMLLVVTLLTTALIAFSRDRSQVSQGSNLRQALWMLAQAAPLTLLLFMLFPRIPGPLWNLPSDSGAAGTGLSDSMSPGNISQLSDNDSVAFRVQFESALPAQTARYWRGPVFTSFDGRTWRQAQTGEQAGSKKVESRFETLLETKGNPVRYSVTLEPHQQRWLFALDLPSLVPPRSRLSLDFAIIADEPVQTLRQYEMRSFIDYRLAAQSPPMASRYLQLPGEVGRRARTLARELRSSSANNAAYVQAVLHYIASQAFYYTRQPPLLLRDAIDEFLFSSRRGFCEHYASAFTFLMRAAGIPARVVTGYQGGEMNPQSDYFIVRQSDAHAWVEVWLKGEGWRRVDPTAVIPAARIEDPQDLARIRPRLGETGESVHWLKSVGRQLGFTWDRINHAWNQWVVNYNTRRQQAFLTRLLAGMGFGGIDWRAMIGLLVAGITMVLLLVGVSLLRSRHGPAMDPAQQAYERFCRRLKRQGLHRGLGEGPMDFARRASAHCPQRAAEIQRIINLYTRQRYAPGASRDTLQQLRQAVQHFKC